MRNSIFVVLMPWDHDGLTMRPCESFMTKEEAEEYVKKGHYSWEIVEVSLPWSFDHGYLLKPVQGVKV